MLPVITEIVSYSLTIVIFFFSNPREAHAENGNEKKLELCYATMSASKHMVVLHISHDVSQVSHLVEVSLLNFFD